MRGTLVPVGAAAANREILLRFLSANGPATAADVARWWGEQPAPAKRWFRDNADALATVEIDGDGGYAVRAEDADELAGIPDGGTDPADAPLLLPGFDPWVIAPLSHRRRAIPEGREAEVSRTAGWISPVLVMDGRIAGVWEPGPAPTVQPFAPLPAATGRAVERLLASSGTWAPAG
jgi:Winged helix DNA-binding domain